MFIEHVNITVSSIQRSIEFYTRLFDWEIRWQGHSTTSGRLAAHIGNDQFYIAMFEAEKSTAWTIDYETVGLNHFGVVIDDLDAMVRRLDDMNVRYGDEQDYEPGRRIYCLDPDGMEVELVQYTATPA